MKGGELLRDKSKARIAGVCAGIAEYFGIEVWLVRILTVTAFLLLAGPFIIVAYVAAWFILDEKSKVLHERAEQYAHKGYVFNSDNLHSSAGDDYKGKGYRNSNLDSESRVEVKARVWQAGQPPRQAFMDIKQRYNVVEVKLRKLESYVTSKEFQLNREMSRL
jgi:phage shock protein C